MIILRHHSSWYLPYTSPLQVVRRKGRAIEIQDTYILFNGAAVASNLEKKMFATSNTTKRLASLAFAVGMMVAVNGGMLLMFDSASQKMASVNSVQPSNVAVLETVTIIGRRV